MRHLFIKIFLILIVCYIEPYAYIGVMAGARIGRIDYFQKPFDDNFVYGAQIIVTSFPYVDLELSSDYYTLDFQHLHQQPLGEDLTLREKLKITGIQLNIKFKLESNRLPMIPYFGVGGALYNLDFQLDEKLPAGFSIVPYPDASHEMGIQGIFGVRFKFDIFPFQLFTEGKYSVVFTPAYEFISQEEVKSWAFYAGINFPVL